MKRRITKKITIYMVRNQIYLLPSIGVVYATDLVKGKLDRVNIAFAWLTFCATFTIWRKDGEEE